MTARVVGEARVAPRAVRLNESCRSAPRHVGGPRASHSLRPEREHSSESARELCVIRLGRQLIGFVHAHAARLMSEVEQICACSPALGFVPLQLGHLFIVTAGHVSMTIILRPLHVTQR